MLTMIGCGAGASGIEMMFKALGNTVLILIDAATSALVVYVGSLAP